LPLCMMGGRPQKLRSDVFNPNESGHGSAGCQCPVLATPPM
jgi:hypothetical protein